MHALPAFPDRRVSVKVVRILSCARARAVCVVPCGSIAWRDVWGAAQGSRGEPWTIKVQMGGYARGSFTDVDVDNVVYGVMSAAANECPDVKVVSEAPIRRVRGRTRIMRMMPSAIGPLPEHIPTQTCTQPSHTPLQSHFSTRGTCLACWVDFSPSLHPPCESICDPNPTLPPPHAVLLRPLGQRGTRGWCVRDQSIRRIVLQAVV